MRIARADDPVASEENAAAEETRVARARELRAERVGGVHRDALREGRAGARRERARDGDARQESATRAHRVVLHVVHVSLVIAEASRDRDTGATVDARRAPRASDALGAKRRRRRRGTCRHARGGYAWERTRIATNVFHRW